MKRILVLILFLSSLISYAQKGNLFDELYECNGDEYKIYLDGVYKVVNKQCADYYIICNIDSSELEFKDSVFLYKLNGTITKKAYYDKGKLDGSFFAYFEDGKIEITGEYKEGNRVGDWKYYYKNGQLKKVLKFNSGNSYPLIESFYNKKGKQKIINGNGKFEDKFAVSISSARQVLFKGKVKNGLMDGKWIIVDNGILTGKEYFKEGIFKEGISFSQMIENIAYFDTPTSTIFEINYMERIQLWGSSACKDFMPLALSTNFYDELYNILKPYQNNLPKRFFFVELQLDNNGIFKDLYVYPHHKGLDDIISIHFHGKKIKTFYTHPQKGRIVFILFNKDDIFFSKRNNIDNYILNGLRLNAI